MSSTAWRLLLPLVVLCAVLLLSQTQAAPHPSGGLASTAELTRLLHAGEQQEMMEVALAASDDPGLAEKLLSRIWRSIQEQEKILQRIGNRAHDFDEIRSEEKKKQGLSDYQILHFQYTE